jgi:nucleotide-binding universal stress UspA family protein
MRGDNILFVSRGLADDTAALTQTIKFIDPAGGRFHALLVAPPVPESLLAYRETLAKSLRNQFDDQWRASLVETGRPAKSIEVTVDVEFEATPAVRAIALAIRESVDLLAKAADEAHGEPGFSSFDLTLLRKSPVPVWLCRGKESVHRPRRIAVAIDPLVTSAPAKALNLRMLRVAHELAAQGDVGLDVVSCWDFEYENDLRRSVWLSIPEDEIAQAVDDADNTHRSAIDRVIHESGIGTGLRLHRERGKPSTIIPRFVTDNKIDMLVMGTVARTGIKGFIMGNTAEGILHALTCSLLAFKPEGFVSPVSPN